ncbi:MAG: HD domain-containing protein [Bacillota bacterium]|nr:HD domain-containing protein [Bacillota bacterium]
MPGGLDVWEDEVLRVVEAVHRGLEEAVGVPLLLVDRQGNEVVGTDRLPEPCRLLRSCTAGGGGCREFLEGLSSYVAGSFREAAAYRCPAGVLCAACAVEVSGRALWVLVGLGDRIGMPAGGGLAVRAGRLVRAVRAVAGVAGAVARLVLSSAVLRQAAVVSVSADAGLGVEATCRRFVEALVNEGGATGAAVVKVSNGGRLVEVAAKGGSGRLALRVARASLDGREPVLAEEGGCRGAGVLVRVRGRRFGLGVAVPADGVVEAARTAFSLGKVFELAVANAVLHESARSAHEGTVRALVAAVEARDVYTRGHSLRVASLARKLAGRLQGNVDSKDVYLAGLLHDVGKIGWPEWVLSKPGQLSPEEREMVQGHPVVGAAILKRGGLRRAVLRAVRHHHENWDGSGYPDGLRGREIPMAARLIRVADAYDAMCSERPYRPALAREAALLELRKGAGREFDPALVAVFERVMGGG